MSSSKVPLQSTPEAVTDASAPTDYRLALEAKQKQENLTQFQEASEPHDYYARSDDAY
jgi:hypothetical protein